MAGPSGLDFFISSDMFYLELVLEASGGVKDVKVHHEGKVEQPQVLKSKHGTQVIKNLSNSQSFLTRKKIQVDVSPIIHFKVSSESFRVTVKLKEEEALMAGKRKPC